MNSHLVALLLVSMVSSRRGTLDQSIRKQGCQRQIGELEIFFFDLISFKSLYTKSKFSFLEKKVKRFLSLVLLVSKLRKVNDMSTAVSLAQRQQSFFPDNVVKEATPRQTPSPLRQHRKCNESINSDKS